MGVMTQEELIAAIKEAAPNDLKPILQATVERFQPASVSTALALLNATPDSANPPPSTLVCVAGVKRERVRWLWEHRIAFGKLNLLDGDPGLGKSTLTLDLAARFSSQQPMPMEELAHPAGNALILSAEDGVADTIRPRLEAAGADLSRIHFLGTVPEWVSKGEGGGWHEVPPVLPDHIPLIEKAIRETEAKIVVIDPLMAFITAKANAHNDQHVRGVLAPLAKMAEDTGCAIIVVRHLNKMSGASALYRGGGSIGIVGAARSALLVGRHPDQEGVFVLVRNKCNLSKWAASLSYTLEDVPEFGTARVAWGDVVDLKADDLLAAPLKRREASKSQEAEEFYMNALADGEVPAAELDERLRAKGISFRTAARVRRELGVKSRKKGFGAESVWFQSLPKAANSATPENMAAFGEDGTLLYERLHEPEEDPHKPVDECIKDCQNSQRLPSETSNSEMAAFGETSPESLYAPLFAALDADRLPSGDYQFGGLTFSDFAAYVRQLKGTWESARTGRSVYSNSLPKLEKQLDEALAYFNGARGGTA